MKSKNGLSVVLATFQEEKNILDCLKSVEDIADEIIVVDESSTDKTREIAKKFKARVFKTIHEPIFHITKNKAISKARMKWVLQLDADERVTPELKKEISQLIEGKYYGYDSWLSPIKKRINNYFPLFIQPKNLSQPAAAYWLPRRNFFLNRYLKHTGQYPDPVIRLFQNGLAVLPAKDVHEQMSVTGTIGWLVSDLDHFATPNFSRYLLRENRYSSLFAEELYKDKVKINVLNTLKYLFAKPAKTFISLFIRYRGFLDGFPGFVFSLYSGLHFAFAYMKLWEIYKKHETN